MSEVIDVAIGVLVMTCRGQPQILIARRPGDAVLGGYWELPGGKAEDGETMPQCLVREFEEELGVTVAVQRELAVVEHVYEHAHVRLHAFYCTHVRGEPRNIACAAHKWVTPRDLMHHEFPPANGALIKQVAAELSPHDCA